MDTKKTLTVANIEQKIAFYCEMSGQISNGWWEKAHPYDHYKDWCLDWDSILIGNDIGTTGIAHWAKRNYNLTNSQLLDVVGHRIRLFITMAKLYPEKVLLLLPTDVLDLGCGHYEDRFELHGITNEMIDHAESKIDDLYPLSQLRKDLKGLKQAMRYCKEEIAIDRTLRKPDGER